MEAQSVLIGADQEVDEKSNLLHQIFEEYLDKHPEITDKIALIFNDNSVTFKQLNQRANKLARYLSHFLNNNRKETHSSNNIIGVFIPPSDDLIVLLFAILKLGASYLPLDPTFPDGRLSYILSDSRPLAVISTRENSSRILKSWNGLIIHHEDLLQQQVHTNLSDENLEENEQIESKPSIAAVLYTSGSTGVPKGAALSYTALINRLKWQWTTFPFNENETCIFKTTLSFVDSIPEIFGSLLQGKKLVIVSREDVKNTQALVEILEKYEIERIMLVPSLLRSIFLFTRMSSQKPRLPKLRMIISSAETITVEFLQEFFKVFPCGKIFANFYGSTEITDVTYSIFETPQDIQDKTVDTKVPIGTPVINTNIYVLDEKHKIVQHGQIGEIYVSGKNVSRYLNQPNDDLKKFDSKFIPNQYNFKPGHNVLYRTGDFGRIINNTLLYEGRTDSQIKIRGQRVDLSEIERAVVTVPGVVTGVVLCYHAGKHDQTVLAFYKTNDNLNENKLNEILTEKLASHMMPLVFKLDDFPLLHNGKIDRQLLIRQFETEALSKLEDANDNIVSQVDADQRAAAWALFNTISQVLGLTRKNEISLESNFFEIGGNSLNVINTISVLLDKGYLITIPDFLQAKTLLEIVNKMKFSSDPTTTIPKLPSTKSKYRTIPITNIPKPKVLSIMSTSFTTKEGLDLLIENTVEDFIEFVEILWESFITSNVSFGVVDVNNEVIGISLNTNIKEEPNFKLDTRMKIILDLLEHIEVPFQTELLGKLNKVMHGLLLGSADTLTAAENVELVQFIEEENVKIAKANDFDAVLTTNTSPLTQDVCCKLLNYEILKSIQVNQYQDKNGFSAFASAPDNYFIQVAVKYLK